LSRKLDKWRNVEGPDERERKREREREREKESGGAWHTRTDVGGGMSRSEGGGMSRSRCEEDSEYGGKWLKYKLTHADVC
jgi:hypothetical protein